MGRYQAPVHARFRNRLDAMVSFKPLDEHHPAGGGQVPAAAGNAAGREEGRSPSPTSCATWPEGLRPLMGARPMQRLIQDTIRRRWPTNCSALSTLSLTYLKPIRPPHRWTLTWLGARTPTGMVTLKLPPDTWFEALDWRLTLFSSRTTCCSCWAKWSCAAWAGLHDAASPSRVAYANCLAIMVRVLPWRMRGGLQRVWLARCLCWRVAPVRKADNGPCYARIWTAGNQLVTTPTNFTVTLAAGSRNRGNIARVGPWPFGWQARGSLYGCHPGVEHRRELSPVAGTSAGSPWRPFTPAARMAATAARSRNHGRGFTIADWTLCCSTGACCAATLWRATSTARSVDGRSESLTLPLGIVATDLATGSSMLLSARRYGYCSAPPVQRRPCSSRFGFRAATMDGVGIARAGSCGSSDGGRTGGRRGYFQPARGQHIR